VAAIVINTWILVTFHSEFRRQFSACKTNLHLTFMFDLQPLQTLRDSWIIFWRLSFAVVNNFQLKQHSAIWPRCNLDQTRHNKLQTSISALEGSWMHYCLRISVFSCFRCFFVFCRSSFSTLMLLVGPFDLKKTVSRITYTVLVGT